MRRLPAFVVLAIGAAFLLGGFWWIAPALRELSSGEARPARVAAMLRFRADGADFISGLRHELRATCRNGDRLLAVFEDHRPVSVLVSGPEDGSPAASARFTTDEGRALLDRLVRGGMEDMRRALLREARATLPDSLAGLTKTETALGRFALSNRPRSFVWDGAGPVALADGSGQTATSLAALVSTARFGSHRVTSADTTAAPPLADGVFERDPAAPLPVAGLADFALYAGGVGTEYRPVLAYRDASGAPRALMADLGKIKGESSAFRLFAPARVVETSTGHALLLPDLRALSVGKSRLQVFGSLSEAVFSRWMYPSVFSLFGVACLVFGLVALTLPEPARAAAAGPGKSSSRPASHDSAS